MLKSLENMFFFFFFSDIPPKVWFEEVPGKPKRNYQRCAARQGLFRPHANGGREKSLLSGLFFFFFFFFIFFFLILGIPSFVVLGGHNHYSYSQLRYFWKFFNNH